MMQIAVLLVLFAAANAGNILAPAIAPAFARTVAAAPLTGTYAVGHGSYIPATAGAAYAAPAYGA